MRSRGPCTLTKVAADSPAAAAGIAVGDRIYAVNDKSFTDGDEFHRTIIRLLDTTDGTFAFTLRVETRGHVRTVQVRSHPQTAAAQAST